jgi:nitroreductase
MYLHPFHYWKIFHGTKVIGAINLPTNIHQCGYNFGTSNDTKVHMNFQNLLLHRYNVTEYEQEPVDQDLLNQVLTAAQFAPTAANRQPFKLIVIHTQGKKEEIQKIYDRDWFSDAPIMICACGIPGQGWGRADGKSYLDVDIAIIMDHISLAAADLGLGTCWVASIDVEAAH